MGISLRASFLEVNSAFGAESPDAEDEGPDEGVDLEMTNAFRSFSARWLAPAKEILSRLVAGG